jgi:hypothetical protein
MADRQASGLRRILVWRPPLNPILGTVTFWSAAVGGALIGHAAGDWKPGFVLGGCAGTLVPEALALWLKRNGRLPAWAARRTRENQTGLEESASPPPPGPVVADRADLTQFQMWLAWRRDRSRR